MSWWSDAVSSITDPFTNIFKGTVGTLSEGIGNIFGSFSNGLGNLLSGPIMLLVVAGIAFVIIEKM